MESFLVIQTRQQIQENIVSQIFIEVGEYETLADAINFVDSMKKPEYFKIIKSYY